MMKVMMMMTPRMVLHGMPADLALQQALAAALQLDSEAGMAARSGDLALYSTLHAAACVQWQVYRDRLAEIKLDKTKKVLDTGAEPV
jgi:hypothetical protein